MTTRPASRQILAGQRNRLVCLRRGRDDDHIDAEVVGQPRCDAGHVIARNDRDLVAAASFGQFAGSLVHIDAEHAAARRLRKLHCQLPDQSQSDDRDRFAEPGIRLAHPLHRDGAERGEGGVRQFYPRRHLGT